MATLFLLVKIRLTEHGWHLWHNAHFQMASAISLLPPWLHVFIQCDLGIVYPEVTFISSSLESGCVWHPGKYDSVSVPGIGLHWPGSFYSSLWEPSHCAGRCPNHMERPHAGNPVYTQRSSQSTAVVNCQLCEWAPLEVPAHQSSSCLSTAHGAEGPLSCAQSALRTMSQRRWLLF